MDQKLRKIQESIEEVTGRTLDLVSHKTYSEELEASLIDDVLLFSTSYDYFLIEEEGRLNTLCKEKFSYGDIRQIPDIKHVETQEECIEKVQKGKTDLLIIFGEPMNTGLEDFMKSVKSEEIDTPVVWIRNDGSQNLPEDDDRLDEVFTWNGDGKIILSIIQYIEDKLRFSKGDFHEKTRPILLVEDSKQYYSSYVNEIYEKIWDYLFEILHDELDRERKIERYLKRPFIILAKDVSEGRKLYKRTKKDLLCVITDNRLEAEEGVEENAGLRFARYLKKDHPDLSVLLQSSSSSLEEEVDKGIEHVDKKDPALHQKIARFVEKHLSPIELSVSVGDGFEEVKVTDIEELEEAVNASDDEELEELISDERLVRWLETLTEYDLAEKFKELSYKDLSFSALRERFEDLMEEYRYTSYRSAVADYRRERGDLKRKINRIGGGALGGKARGLAFISKLFSNYLPEDLFKDLKITVPRTTVLTSTVFEKFLEENEITVSELFDLSDERISSRFISGSLPATIIGDLRSFVRKTDDPLIVRSSGVLEDSLTRPFAGVYSSMFLPNESWETSLRFKEVCDAIKHVYASTFFKRASDYVRTTPKNITDEKMSVIIQEVVGKKHGNHYYPTISGVAKSHNYYSTKGCKPEDGIVYLSLGLGKEIVEGGSSYHFCPECPKSPMFGTPKDFIPHSQTEFYALNLESIYRVVGKDEDTSLSKLDITTAEEHGVLDKIASTYSPKDDRLYPGTGREGSRVIDFAPIINYDYIPLADAIKLLLKVAETALGYPVEIEFAVDLNKKESERSELVVLQIRSMISGDELTEVDIEKCDDSKLVCRTDKTLGHSMIEEINDVVYTKPGVFEMKNSEQAAQELRKVNDKLMEEDREYILIGPGRWGTTDPWMGIPVEWGEIAGAKVIVELPAKGRTIEPSQGSHFFHDMISSETCYMVIDDEEKIDWEWLEEQTIEEESENIKHVRTEQALEVRVDGKEGRSAIIKNGQKGSETNNVY